MKMSTGSQPFKNQKREKKYAYMSDSGRVVVRATSRTDAFNNLAWKFPKLINPKQIYVYEEEL